MAAHSPPTLASNNEFVRKLVDLRCRSVSYEEDLTLARDFDSLEIEAKKRVKPDIIDVILEMTEKYRLHRLLSRECGRKNPVAVIYNLVNGTQGQSIKYMEEGKAIYEDRLKALLGPGEEEQAEAIRNMIMAAAWGEQNCLDWDISQGGYLTGSAKGYLEASGKNRLWADYYAKRMGFDKKTAPAWISVNSVIKKLCVAECREWTSSNNADGGIYPRQARAAAVQIAEKEAGEAQLNPDFVQQVMLLARKYRLCAHYSRLRGAGSDGCVTAEHEARRILDEKLRPMVGKQAGTLWEMCKYSAWCEQNLVDADNSHTHAEAQAYSRVALKEKSALDKAAFQLDLSEAPDAFLTNDHIAPEPDDVPMPKLFPGGEEPAAPDDGKKGQSSSRCCACFSCKSKKKKGAEPPPAKKQGAEPTPETSGAAPLPPPEKDAKRKGCGCFGFLRHK